MKRRKSGGGGGRRGGGGGNSGGFEWNPRLPASCSAHLSVQPSFALILVFLQENGDSVGGDTSDQVKVTCQVVSSLTLVQTPVVASHRLRMEMFWARFSQLMASLVLVAHFTMVT